MVWAGLPRLLPLVHKIIVQLHAPKLLPNLRRTTHNQAHHMAFLHISHVSTYPFPRKTDRDRRPGVTQL